MFKRTKHLFKVTLLSFDTCLVSGAPGSLNNAVGCARAIHAHSLASAARNLAIAVKAPTGAMAYLNGRKIACSHAARSKI